MAVKKYHDAQEAMSAAWDAIESARYRPSGGYKVAKTDERKILVATDNLLNEAQQVIGMKRYPVYKK